METEVSVLGELRITARGTDVTPTAPKEKALLALLVVQRRVSITTDRLAEELWPDLPPGRSRRVAQVRIGDLRQRLRRAGGMSLLRTSPSGYRFELELGALDAERFESLIDSARSSSGDGGANGRAATLRAALDLWRGPPYADVRGASTVDAEASRLEELRSGALEDWVAKRHPLRERLWEQWILALYRSGRQADALRACAAVRRQLNEVLGVDPSPALRELEMAVLQQRAELDWPAPVPTGGAAGWSPPVTADAVVDARADAGSARPSEATTTGNLPTFDRLIGRHTALIGVSRLVREHRLVTVTGAGGVGKSRLAVAAAALVAPEMPAGTWLVELAPVTDAAGLLGAVAGVVPVPAMVTTASELAGQIGRWPTLIVLDNCEHIIDDVAALVSTLLPSCPELRLLCTSQETLDVDGEHIWPLQPLEPEAAVALFDERARAVRPDVVTDPAIVAEIVERLDRLPLAIELAAARVMTFGLEEIAARLGHRLGFLQSRGRGRPARHAGLRAMVEWSHDVLDPDERRVFRRLAVFAGGFTADGASRVAGLGSGDEDRFIDLLDHLVRRSLVVADLSATPTRYGLLETLRHYATERLVAAGEHDAMRRRHASWCIELAEELEEGAADEVRYLSRGQAELDNFGAAVAWAVEVGDTDLAVRLVGRLWRLHFLWRAELVGWARQVLALPGAEDHPDVGYVHLIVALLAWPTGGIDESERAARAALSRPLPEDAWWWATTTRISMLFYQGRLQETMEVLAAAGDGVTTPANRVNLRGHEAAGEGVGGRPVSFDLATFIKEADATCSQWSRCVARQTSALALLRRRRPLEAEALLLEGLDIARPGLNRLAVGILNETLQLIPGRSSSTEDSDVEARAARALELEADYPVSMGYALIGLLVALERLGRNDDAALLAGHLSTNSVRLGTPLVLADTMSGGPLDRFDAPPSQQSFARGRLLTPDQLDDELRRLASG